MAEPAPRDDEEIVVAHVTHDRGHVAREPRVGRGRRTGARAVARVRNNPHQLVVVIAGEIARELGVGQVVGFVEVVEVARKHNLVAGAFAGTPEIIKNYMAMGYTFITAVTDNDVLKLGIAAALHGV